MSPNFLIGQGEQLTRSITIKSGFGEPTQPYEMGESVDRLSPMFTDLAADVQQLPDKAFPKDRAVAAITLHPQFLARSYFPDRLVRDLGGEVLGSRPIAVEPSKWARKKPPEGEAPSTQLFVSAPRSEITKWPSLLEDRSGKQFAEIIRVERLHMPQREEKLRIPESNAPGQGVFEVVLHSKGDEATEYVLSAFKKWCKSLGVKARLKRSISAGGLTFVPIEGDLEAVERAADFSFLRAVRPMPHLRTLRPVVTKGGPSDLSVGLPQEKAVDDSTSVVIFDGGLPIGSSLEPWCTSHQHDIMSAPTEEFTTHGHMVTSALLFGSLHELPTRPFTNVDHFQILDDKSKDDPYELYRALSVMQDVLEELEPEFINLSVGPHLPIEDDEVHSWTAVLDEYLAHNECLATVAVGNDGDLDRESGNARIQVPSDSVNALAVGASQSRTKCDRAPYSSVGPGRSPGLIKPDVISFGGGLAEPFVVNDPEDGSGGTQYQSGTSFAAPNALRTALGLRAHLGDSLSPMTLKALLVHAAADEEQPVEEVGWGRVPTSFEEIAVCPPNTARVVYQGVIEPAKYLRARIPVPGGLNGMVTVAATFAFSSETDPQDPSNYTRSGLEVIYRPHAEKFAKADSTEPEPKPFFGSLRKKSERDLRNDAHKWETAMHRTNRHRASSLLRPVFDIHYLARSGGSAYSMAPPMRYSLIVDVISPKTPDVYDRVLRAYPTQLKALVPLVDIRIDND